MTDNARKLQVCRDAKEQVCNTSAHPDSYLRVGERKALYNIAKESERSKDHRRFIVMTSFYIDNDEQSAKERNELNKHLTGYIKSLVDKGFITIHHEIFSVDLNLAGLEHLVPMSGCGGCVVFTTAKLTDKGESFRWPKRWDRA